jgi:hypothetical protein
MFLTVHSAVGVALSRGLSLNPFASFVVGLAAHYAADAVPHGDDALGAEADKLNHRQMVLRYFIAAAIDGAVLLAFLTYVWIRRGITWPEIAAVAGSCLPDVLYGLHKAFGWRLLKPHADFHHRVHNYFKIKLPTWFGFVGQGAAAVLIWVFVVAG